jgi:hypothetical protein
MQTLDTRPNRPQNARRLPLRAKQQGFVATAAQVTMALVALAVSASAFSLDSIRQQAAEQVAHVHASYLLKAGADLETALVRAAGDSGLSRSAVSRTVAFLSVSSASQVGLFDAQLGYGRVPQWPDGLLAQGVEGAGSLRWADGEGQVVEMTGIDPAVCRRFNEMVQGTDIHRAPPADLATARRERGWTQGCWAEEGAQAGTWFMEPFAEAHCRGAACRSGDVVGASARQMIAAASEPAPEAVPSPLDALVQCATREAASGIRDPQLVAERCRVST